MNGPQRIYLIRHGEKPTDVGGESSGVDVDGTSNKHSLTPRGWQRSGALAVLFTRPPGPGLPAMTQPDQLLSPDYGKGSKTTEHRAYQTLIGLSGLIGRPIDSPFPLGHESDLAAAVLSGSATTTLICWEHNAIPDIAKAIPTDPSTPAPDEWPDDRFDLVWLFTRTVDEPARYAFRTVPQHVLGGDEAPTA